MSEPEIATKAPESDAAVSPPAGVADAPAPQTAQTGGAAVSEHCVTDRPTPAGQASTGEIRKIDGIDVYVSKPSDYPHAPARLLLLLTGGTGLRSTNNQIQADRFASEGFVVAMPDLFSGDPAPNSTTTLSDDASGPGSFLDQFKLKAAETAKSFLIDMWLARHTEEKVRPILHRVLTFVRADPEFSGAVSNGGGVYAVGYCFGARYVLLLASERTATGLLQPEEASDHALPKGPFIKAGALAHATLVSPDDFQGLKAPVSLVCVESDPMFPDEVRATGEEYMAKHSLEHEVQVYPGVPHGFAVVGEYEDENIKAAQATAFEQMLKWLKEH